MASSAHMSAASAATRELPEFCSDVVIGLSHAGQKELPSKYLYDSLGSVLFDAICLLPEYGLSRAGIRLLQRHGGEIIDRVPGPVVVAELGSGNGQKTRYLLEALGRRQRVNYYPIDISGSALFRCQQELGHLEMVSLVGFESAYLDGLQKVAARRLAGERLLVLFLGSTIGNFDRSAGEQFLLDVRGILQQGDSLLLATDLEKPVSMLKLAYDDPPGVTAAFNKNILARINRELDGEFDLNEFEHVVRYDQNERRIEMHLRSKRWQGISIRKAGFRFQMREGETIWTESSHKYDPAEVKEMGRRAGFDCVQQWVDAEWPFAESLFFAV
ncbi:MAG: L-histidine N(alpha)-methyltransferase [Candidatus Acidiferrales bacterium]